MQLPALITVAIPSLNQGRYLADTLRSVFDQQLPVEVFLADGGSTDESLEIIKEFEPQLAGWRSHADDGQAAAINECIARGRAPYVCWLNSDDMFVTGGLLALVEALQADPSLPAAYGRTWNLIEDTGERSPVRVEPFSARRLARRCIISQPATLIRRSAWEAVDGLDGSLKFAMDYDLWWRLHLQFGDLRFVDHTVAISRDHAETKTRRNGFEHYKQSSDIVFRHHGAAPFWARFVPLQLRWRLARFKHWLTR